jgi:hypothetical protein
MWDSLQQLAALPDDVVVYPGHLYAPDPFAALGEVKQTNYVYRVTSRDQWVRAFA